MRNNNRFKIYIDEACRALQEIGYADAQKIDQYTCDIEVSSLGVGIQVFNGGWDEDESVRLFAGSLYDDGYDWRLLKADYAFIILPERYLLIETRPLLEFILDNHFEETERVRSKRSESIVVKLRVPWLVYGLPAEAIKMLNRPSHDQARDSPDRYAEISIIRYD